jgi:hypothetical protein
MLRNLGHKDGLCARHEYDFSRDFISRKIISKILQRISKTIVLRPFDLFIKLQIMLYSYKPYLVLT